MMEGFRHRPVLPDEVLRLLDPHKGEVYVDCTLGEAGHAAEIGGHLGPQGTIIGLDRDPEALTFASAKLQSLFAGEGPRLHLIRANFTALSDVLTRLGIAAAHRILFDLGVSSRHLDDASRGFTYNEPDAPLDMRMDPGQQLTAETILNEYSEQSLTDLIRRYGEDRWASRIAAFIVQARDRAPLRTTGQLVKVIEAAIPAAARRTGPHPARRTFQALRIAVNDELDPLERTFRTAVDWLAPAGRIAIISFHSLEDRIVKHTFRAMAHEGKVIILTRKPVEASQTEVETNPRSRSAKLRVAEKAS